MIVGPTWMSLICAMRKPCSAAGRLWIGTSTTTTAAVRRALHKPTSVMAAAASATAAADPSVSGCRSKAPGAKASTAIAGNSNRSRASVNTKSDENRPMKPRPTQASLSDQRRERMRRASRPQGISTADKVSTAASATCAGGSAPSAGNNRHAT